MEGSIIKDVRNLSGLQNEKDDTAIKSIRRWTRKWKKEKKENEEIEENEAEKKNETINDRVVRDIENLFWEWTRRLLKTSKSR